MAKTAQTPSEKGQALIPALDPGASYYSRLSARSALYTDLHVLLDANPSILSSAEYRSMILDDNCLARSSAAARQKMWKELKARYILDSDHPLFRAFWEEWRRCDSDPEFGLTAYVLLALNDRLVADLGIEWLFARLRRAPAELRVTDVLGFLKAAATAHPEIKAWSESTTTAVAQKYCASIRDFGLAKGAVRKTTVRPALYGAPTRLIVRALRLAVIRDLDILHAPVFKLIGLDNGEIIEAMGELNRQGSIWFRMQGDVVEMDIGGGR